MLSIMTSISRKPEIMREHDYVKRIMDRVPYALPETQEKMDILAAEMGEYMDERIRNKK